jgi:L-iditol 2-dehydrogenase
MSPCYSLPDNVSFEEGSLAEPLSVLIHASRRAGLESGQTVLVYGVGTIGLLACALAKSYGCSRVVAVDINQARLSFAKTHGFAEDVFCLSANPKAKSPEEQLRRARENADCLLEVFGEDNGFDVVFECTGAEPCIQMAIHVRDSSSVFPGYKVN